MARPHGNPNRCRKCNSLAGKDGWCSKHRPPKARRYSVRDNYLDNNFLTKHKEFYRDTYGIVSDKYPAEGG